jgi:hypothetical protein
LQAAKAKLMNTDRALKNAIEAVENILKYSPVSILGITMSPALLVTIAAVALGLMFKGFHSFL